jgi:ATP-dependent helicase HrpB
LNVLPIEASLARIVEMVSTQEATLLQATPGSGKTTLVPLALMRHFKGKILVLEPRRIATRWAAQRVSELVGETLGLSVGYMYRFEQKTSEQTRLIFLTEGTFLRYLQSNPRLDGVDAVVLDEFHERHLATDLAFGLFRALSRSWQKKPRLLIMSATLDESPLKKNFPDLKKIDIVAPVFPLEQKWSPREAEWAKRTLESKVMWGIQEAWNHPGDMLVFLPGMGEIRRIETLLKERLGDFPARVLMLHGQESSPEHELMKPLPERKIILASNVAESSVTIPGVRIVIDAGLQREAVFSAWSGQTDLVTNLCSQASAIQRAGRAARTASGVCLRLYTENDFNARPSFTTPELLKTDLAEVLMELAQWNLIPEEFPWPDTPTPDRLQHARALLTELSAVSDNKLTAVGSQMRLVPLPVRAARVWVEGRDRGNTEAFRDLCRQIAHWLERGEQARKLEERLRHGPARGQEIHAEKFWLSGFADRIAKGRSVDVITVTGDTFKLSPEVKNVWDPRRPYWLALEVNGVQKHVTKLIPLEAEWVLDLATPIVETVFDEKRGKMVKRTSLKLGALTLETSEVVLADSPIVGRGPLEKAARQWLGDFQNSTEYVRWDLFQTTRFADKPLAGFEWELFLEEFLLEDFLPTPEHEREFLQRLRQELQLYLDDSFRLRVQDVCPTHFALHEKRSCEIHYDKGQPPWIEAHIQDFFGRTTHPSLADGKIPLTIHLWGPHGRALQVTGDLPGFWTRHYPSLKKELMRDYPRHFWPEMPTTAVPMLRLPRKK